MLATDLFTRWPALDVAARCSRLQGSLHVIAGPLGEPIDRYRRAAESAADGLWRRDPAVWSADAAVQQKVKNRLGWLDSPALMADSLDRLHAFAHTVRRDGFTDVVLLGMGGSSLAPEVLRAVLGRARADWPRLHMLDSTDPAAVLGVHTVPERTLYLISSKSGTTIEPNVLAAHFRRTLEDARVPNWASHFVAITDAGTELEARGRAEGFREVFINPSDIGGRYSALSFFGLVPAALMGLDTAALVGWGLGMLAAAEGRTPSGTFNPAVTLGLAIGAAARSGRDKLTLVLPPALEPFGLWVEQLIAESTGKHGTGVVPVAGETLGPPETYGRDRLFVRIRIRGSFAEEMRDTEVRDLERAGDPVVELELPEPSALGAEFVRWEVATAVAGALLEINPFDEPNVQQAKDATRTLLREYVDKGRLPVPKPDRVFSDATTLTVSSAARQALANQGPEALLTLLREGDYFALLAYLAPESELFDDFKAFRHTVRERTHAATVFGYGPRYLHSTGQLHKGGPNTGVFFMLTATPRRDASIPNEQFSFGTLELAQALGDFTSLEAAGRRVLHVHLPAGDRAHLRVVTTALLGRLGPPQGAGG